MPGLPDLELPVRGVAGDPHDPVVLGGERLEEVRLAVDDAAVSNRAPDFASEVRTSTRSVAPATSSSRLDAASAAAAAVSVATSGLHLGQQRGRPAAAAEDSVPADPVAVHGEQVHLVGGVRHAVLDPAQVELDGLAAGDRAGGPRPRWWSAASYQPDSSAATASAPSHSNRQCGTVASSRASVAQVSGVMPAPRADLGEEPVDGVRGVVMAAPSYAGVAATLQRSGQEAQVGRRAAATVHLLDQLLERGEGDVQRQRAVRRGALGPIVEQLAMRSGTLY